MKIAKGQVLNNAYMIEGPLSSRGGTATVYMASSTAKPELKVAVKFANTDGSAVVDEDVLLRHEASILSRSDWRHPGILRLFPILHYNKPQFVLRAVGLDDEPSFFVMELVEGGTLGQRIKQVVKYSFEWKIEFLYNLAIILNFIHEKGYGHRDIKPDNIMFRESPTPEKVPQMVLIDFALTSNGRETLALIESSYTLEYAAPERVMQAAGMIPTQFQLKSQPQDIWSFGMLTYEIFTGELPFRGTAKDIRTTLIGKSFDEKFLRENPLLPDDIADFIRAILRSDPERRPSMNRIIDLLEYKYRPPRL